VDHITPNDDGTLDLQGIHIQHRLLTRQGVVQAAMAL